MTAFSNSESEQEDRELLELLDSLNLHAAGDSSPANPPPRTPSPAPAATQGGYTFPFARQRVRVIPTTPVVYRYQTPSTRGETSEWAIAGAATQGVPGATVSSVQPSSNRKRKGGKKAAYVVFCGKEAGVFLSWEKTAPLVISVSNSIFRGYKSVDEARAAFDYAYAKGWTRVTKPGFVHPIPTLPQPAPAGAMFNPLHVSESEDDSWYLVYRGIQPGVYRSHLECQLNTLGVPGAVHECVRSKVQAFAKFAVAENHGDVRVIPPSYVPDF